MDKSAHSDALSHSRSLIMVAYTTRIKSLLSTSDSLPVVSVLAGTIGLIGLGIFAYAFYQLRLSPLSKIPGPLLARISPLWRTRRVLIGNWHEDIVALHAKYGQCRYHTQLMIKEFHVADIIKGDVVRISPQEIAINTPDAVQKIYGHTGKPWVKVTYAIPASIKFNF